MPRTTHCTTHISQIFFSNVHINCNGLHSKSTEHQLYYNLFNIAVNYDIIHFRAIDCSSYITN